MSRTERTTFWACFAGWATDAADVQIYSLVIPVLITTGFLHGTSQAGLISTVTLLCSAIGGWVAGIAADRFGRVLTLQVTVLWFSFFTLLCGIAQDPVQLGIFRALMGFGFGGEWAVGAVLMAETVRSGIRGRAVGSVQSGWAVGWGCAVGIFVLVSQFTTPAWTWRILFFAGVVPALLVIFLRRHVAEPTLNAAVRKKSKPALWAIFGPGLRRRTLLCSMLAIGAQGGYYALTTWLPQFLAAERGLKVLALGGTLGLIIAGAFCGYLLGAHLSDAIGRRKTLIFTSIGAFSIVLPFLLLHTSPVVFTILCFPLGLFSSAYFSAIGPLFSEQFPTEMRAAGQGFSYNFGRGIGALFPASVGVLSAKTGIAPAIALFAGCAYLLVVVSAFLITEHPSTDLDVIGETEVRP